jgi:hypothetical protein
MSATLDMQALADEMRLRSGVVASEFAPLPSGIAYLHVRTCGRCFVMAFYPKQSGFGVDEVLDGEGFEMGYRHWFTDFDEARRMFVELIAGTEAPDIRPG